MQFSKSLMPFFAALCLFSSIPFAHADDGPPPGGPEMGKRCHDDPDKCQAMKERREQWCKEHTERCEVMKKKREQMREECKKDPEACKKKREEMREKFHQRMEEKCKQNPEKCAEWKQHHAHGDGPSPEGSGDKPQ